MARKCRNKRTNCTALHRSVDLNKNLDLRSRKPFLYGLVNKTGIHMHVLDEPMSLEQMQMLVGDETEKSFIEMVYNQFSDPDIVLICDDSFLLKGFLPTCKTMRGVVLHGQVIIARVVASEVHSLTIEQYQVVINELLEYVF